MDPLDPQPITVPTQGLKNVTYPKIPVKKKGQKSIAGANPEQIWVVTEKIHGCNFSFVTNGIDLGCARRTELLTENETFYGWQMIRDKHKDGIFGIFKDVQELVETERGQTIDQVLLFGELFGGIYPHPEVEDLGLLHCQKGVYYSPAVEFLAFDILYTLPGKTEKHFVAYDKVLKILHTRGILCVPPLFEGSLQDCFAFDIKRDSVVPQLLGYPPLKNNQIEGVVIKELCGCGIDVRKIFKYKNAKFEEVNPKVPATKYEQKRDARAKKIENFYEELDRYINENRLNNLRSKFGEVTMDNINENAQRLAADALEDFCIDNPDLWKQIGEIGDTVQEKCTKTCENKCRGFIQEWLNQKV